MPAGRQKNRLHFPDDLALANDFGLDIILVRMPGLQAKGNIAPRAAGARAGKPLTLTLASFGTETVNRPLSAEGDWVDMCGLPAGGVGPEFQPAESAWLRETRERASAQPTEAEAGSPVPAAGA